MNDSYQYYKQISDRHPGPLFSAKTQINHYVIYAK